eukprot:CAMPEP_0180829526 /NCGR_PEP_ID=MMETSP1038_2-20121128/75305_1 /TAXON_ID=632150 /ORGANISM="Azadinium spinosum, Strain 3D9" /LENGTH=127 /DNA_ID=CAMNT_0022872569 /DNA_START=879 /DNA_END=1259 /DNA_ORIENTATION=-
MQKLRTQYSLPVSCGSSQLLHAVRKRTITGAQTAASRLPPCPAKRRLREVGPSLELMGAVCEKATLAIAATAPEVEVAAHGRLRELAAEAHALNIQYFPWQWLGLDAASGDTSGARLNCFAWRDGRA